MLDIGNSKHLINLLKQCKIFASLDDASLAYLLPRLELIRLQQGDVLFKQGDPSDYLPILISGRLNQTITTATGEIKDIGTIEVGETIDELCTLTQAPHTRTVQAIYDCELFKLSQHHFAEFCRQYPTALLNVLTDYTATREQKLIQAISEKKIRKNIAIISADGSDLADFINDLAKNIQDGENLILVKQSNLENHNEEYLTQIINHSLSKKIPIAIILHSDLNQYPRALFDVIDKIYIVADAIKTPHFSEFVLKILNRERFHFVSKHELVLLHHKTTINPLATRYWLAKGNFNLHHHIRRDNTEDYKRLLRFMTGKAIGLVLGGGGARGWVHLGVIKALFEANIPIDAVGGTSIGAVAGACLISSKCYEEVEAKFNVLVAPAKRFYSLKNFTWPITSLFSAKHLEIAGRKIFENLRIEDLNRNFYCNTSNLNRNEEVYFNKGDMGDALRATISLPGIWPPVLLNNELHVDGGLLNNLTVNYMRNLLDNEGIIIASSLANIALLNSSYDFPSQIPFMVGMRAFFKWGPQPYKFPSLLNTFLKSLLLGALSREKTSSQNSDILIMPTLENYSMFSFNPQAKAKLFNVGYQEAQQKLANTNHLFP